MALALMVNLFAGSLCAGYEWNVGVGYRWARLPVPASGRTGFTLMDPLSLGIDFTNRLVTAAVEQRQNRMNGEGVAAADFNGDGLVDLLFLRKQDGNQLFLNQGGGKFRNATESSGLACPELASVGVVVGDLNGDGFPDVVLSSFGGPHACLLNDGTGHFTNVLERSGITGTSGGTSMALADLDGDGTLDLYFCNFAVEAILRDGGAISARTINGVPTVTGRYSKRLRIRDGRMEELGDPDVVYLNDGHGRFRQLPWEESFVDEFGKPVPPPRDLGFAVQIRDVNGDGFPDIYVCSDFQTPDHLWLGDGRGHFREASSLMLRNMSYASMGVDFADLDRDGRMDMITVEMLDPYFPTGTRNRSPAVPALRIPGQFQVREEFHRNALYHQRADGTFAELACLAGVAATGWSWTPLFLDVDLDGYEDLLVSNGFPHDVENRDLALNARVGSDAAPKSRQGMLAKFPALELPKFAFRNRRDLTFEDVSKAWGFDSTRVATGMIVADIDGDGDLDVVANCSRGAPLIYRNDSIAPRVAVRLKGRAPNTGGVGARLTLTGGPVVQTQEIVAGGLYLSSSEPMRVFAAGAGGMQLEVRWRSGRSSLVTGVQANRIYEVEEPDAPPAASADAPRPASSPAWYRDASDALDHLHAETLFSDFSQQPLLPHRLSQLGPAVRIADVNGDGHPDVVLGASRGGQVEVRLGDGRGGFRRVELPGGPLPDDVVDVLVAALPGGPTSVLATLANWESGDPTQPSVLRWEYSAGGFKSASPLPPLAGSPGAMALGDLDGDRGPELFVGGRVVPRRWPESPASKLYRARNGGWVEDELASRVLATAGMVTGAAMADLTGDGKEDLIVATEFGPVRVFTWSEGLLKEWNPPLRGAPVAIGSATPSRLSELTGAWRCIAVGDLDHDGRPDVLVGNAGLNSAWAIWGDGLPIVYYGDVIGDGTVAVLEAVRVGSREMPWRDRDYLGVGFPELTARYATHREFASQSVEQVLGTYAPKTRRLACRCMASGVLMNRGDHLEFRALPAEAQWSAVNAIAVGDVNGDGHADVFLAQNDFAARPEDMRVDAGRGLWLVGDGKGGLLPVDGDRSGVKVYGEQRGAAMGDLDGDGRPDLVVTQNGAISRLFLSGAPKPGSH